MDEKKINSGEQQMPFAHPDNRMTDGKKDEASQPQASSLAKKLQRGDHGAAEELVDLYYKQIYLFMRRMGHSCHTSEDLTQDCFMQVWNHIARLRDDKALNSWIYRIAANISRHYWRRHKNIIDIDKIIVASDSPDSADEMKERDRIYQLRFEVMKLPRKLKEVVVLHYMQRLSIKEAAEVLDIREGTFKSRLTRAIKTLKKVLTID